MKKPISSPDPVPAPRSSTASSTGSSAGPARIAEDEGATIPDLGRALAARLDPWSPEAALALLAKHAAGTPLEARLAAIAPEILSAVLRMGAGRAACNNGEAIAAWISVHPGRWAGILSPDARLWPRVDVALGGEHSRIAAASARQDRATAQRLYDAMMAEAGARLAVGAWMEHRSVYTTDNYRSLLVPGARRDRHLGLDLFAPALTPLAMPMPGTVVQTGIIDEPLDYGGFLVTRHEIAPGVPLFALWGHLDHASARRWSPGEAVPEGAELARLGDFEENGWWLPHLHLQLGTLEFADFRAMPGVGESACAALWAEIFPDPTALVLGG